MQILHKNFLLPRGSVLCYQQHSVTQTQDQSPLQCSGQEGFGGGKQFYLLSSIKLKFSVEVSCLKMYLMFSYFACGV